MKNESPSTARSAARVSAFCAAGNFALSAFKLAAGVIGHSGAMISDGKAAVWWTCTGTHLGKFMGHAPTGRKFSFSVMNFYYFNDEGRIVRDVAGEGLAGLLKALGIV